MLRTRRDGRKWPAGALNIDRRIEETRSPCNTALEKTIMGDTNEK